MDLIHLEMVPPPYNNTAWGQIETVEEQQRIISNHNNYQGIHREVGSLENGPISQG
jgi:hypothetical protein